MGSGDGSLGGSSSSNTDGSRGSESASFSASACASGLGRLAIVLPFPLSAADECGGGPIAERVDGNGQGGVNGCDLTASASVCTSSSKSASLLPSVSVYVPSVSSRAFSVTVAQARQACIQHYAERSIHAVSPTLPSTSSSSSLSSQLSPPDAVVSEDMFALQKTHLKKRLQDCGPYVEEITVKNAHLDPKTLYAVVASMQVRICAYRGIYAYVYMH
jgi:hypothetical protein